MPRMDENGDRYIRRNGKWAKIHKQTDGKGYTLVEGYEGQFKGRDCGLRRNIRYYDWAKQWAANWLDNR